MDLFLNELSFHGQYFDSSSFRKAFADLLQMREAARQEGTDIFSKREVLLAMAMPDATVLEAVARLTVDNRRTVMAWLTRGGPFWDDLRRHRGDDYLECAGEIVTDTAVGETGFRVINGAAATLISAKSIYWNVSPIDVVWLRSDERLDDLTAAVENIWTRAKLMVVLQTARAPIGNWFELQDLVAARFVKLVFSDDWLEPLDGVPFARSGAERFFFLLEILDRLASAFDQSGQRTTEGWEIHKQYFTGDNALFSDSSDTEKDRFGKRLTFAHPQGANEKLFAAWHGKVYHQTLRLHYSWSGRANDSVFVVYAGPKLTKH